MLAGMVDVVDPCSAGGAATPNLPALIAAVVGLESRLNLRKKCPGGRWLLAAPGGNRRIIFGWVFDWWGHRVNAGKNIEKWMENSTWWREKSFFLRGDGVFS